MKRFHNCKKAQNADKRTKKNMLLKNIEKIVTYSLVSVLVLLPECLVPFTAFSFLVLLVLLVLLVCAKSFRKKKVLNCLNNLIYITTMLKFSQIKRCV